MEGTFIIPQDWAGNNIKVGDTVYLVRIYELKPGIIPEIWLPEKTKPCWVVVTTFNVTEYQEGARKLYRYFYRNSGYDPDKVYDAPINGNDLRHGLGSDTYILCIKGVSDSQKMFLESGVKPETKILREV